MEYGHLTVTIFCAGNRQGDQKPKGLWHSFPGFQQGKQKTMSMRSREERALKRQEIYKPKKILENYITHSFVE